MKISFLGDIVVLPRISELAEQAVRNGHEVTIHDTSNNGFIKSVLSTLDSLFSKSNTIHVHGWNSAFLIYFFQLFIRRDVTLVWTIGSLPALQKGFAQTIFSIFLPRITSTFDRICVPSRTLQYQLLSIYGIHALYIPDGYTKPVLDDVQPRIYGLRNNQYGVILAKNTEDIERIMEAHASTRSKKKMVVFTDGSGPAHKKLLKKYPLLTYIALPLTSRGAQSIVRTAGFVIITDPIYSHFLLQAMDANRIVIATTSPLIEETLGTTGFYYSPEDTTHITQLLHDASKGLLRQKYPPATRAQHHFTWEKAGLEYEHTYTRNMPHIVPLDSIIPKRHLDIVR